MAAVLLVWSATCGTAMSQTSPAGTNASTPNPTTATRSEDPDARADARAACPDRPEPGLDEAVDMVVTLDPETLWRPRGGEVRFRVTDRSGATRQVRRVQACMGWSPSPAARAGSGTSHELVPAPAVRSIQTDAGGALFGAVVPDLPSAPSPWWPTRLLDGTDVSYTAGETVPVADMVVRITMDGGAPVTVSIPVGVTNLAYALFALVLLAVATSILAARMVSERPGRPRDLVLRIISAPDGYASLSQFQILLWTATVAISAVYVMVLSGNLIPLSSGTLILLGISGGAALAARIPSSAPVRKGTGRTGAPPLWSDLVVVDGDVDLTRVQMLAFTLISAAFVLLKVAVGYVIPDVPPNFLLLMGISNGIYVAGRRLPDRGGESVAGIDPARRVDPA